MVEGMWSEASRLRRIKMNKSEIKHPRDPDAVIMDCLCPLCRKTYQRKLHWIGRGIPRKFCGDCLDLIDKGKYHPSIDHFEGRSSPAHKMPERQDTKIQDWKLDH